MMRCAVILHAPIGGGKTRTAEVAAGRARADGIKVMGVLSMRIPDTDGGDPRYEILELDTGLRVPLVKPICMGSNGDWESLGNPRFAFSREGFSRANLALQRAAEGMREGAVVFVDEYGRLESERKGVYPGAVAVADSLRQGGVAVYLCRGDKVAEVTELVKGKATRTFALEAGDSDALLRIILGCSRL